MFLGDAKPSARGQSDLERFDGPTFSCLATPGNFTPPRSCWRRRTNLALVQQTTQQPAVTCQRSGVAGTIHVFESAGAEDCYAIPGPRGRTIDA